MRYLIISDVHANLEALEAVLQEAGQVDATLFLGDLVGYGPNPNECVQCVRDLPRLTAIIGNHDVAALGTIDVDSFNAHAKFAALWTRKELSDEARAFLSELTQIETIDSLTLVHGSPRDPIWEYLEYASQVPENFARLTTPSCLVGHTHVPRIFVEHPDPREYEIRLPGESEVVRLDDGVRRILNPGGVGQPRDGDPRAAFAIYDDDTRDLSFRRVAYDVACTQRKIEAAGLPRQLGDRLAFGF